MLDKMAELLNGEKLFEGSIGQVIECTNNGNDMKSKLGLQVIAISINCRTISGQRFQGGWQ
jgi:hypothetical protein